ncbi:hypothetical protein ACIQAA_27490 [Neobacillus sp. NPDC093182]|uniref:hypothetical protein n=1 Tax=Neobacillus sp. NPDC093182 TaxID=3364297 RepID=UPI0037F5A6E5
MLNPNPNICKSIVELERLLLELNLFDEVKELVGIPFSQMIYIKQGEDVLAVGVSKSDYYLKLSGYKWSLAAFLQLPIEMEFTIDKTLSWKLSNLENVNISQLEQAMKEWVEASKDLQQLMRFILFVIKAYASKATFLNESVDRLKNMVLEHFWKGEINLISQLYEKSTQSKAEQFNQFINKWEEKLTYSPLMDANRFTAAMDIERSSLHNLIKTIQVYGNQSVNKFIHSEKNLWFDVELLQDEARFYAKVHKIRSIILTTQDYLKDMEELFKENGLDEQGANNETNNHNSNSPNTNLNNVHEPESGLSPFLFLKTKEEKSIAFINKSDIFSGNPKFIINEKSLDKLADYLSDGKKNKKEYINLIGIIFNKSLTKGFTVREIVRTFFISKYDNETERKDFEQRYDVKRLFVKSTLENIFETLMDKLIEVNVIKEERTVIQAKQQEKITFNYNFQIYVNFDPYSM